MYGPRGWTDRVIQGVERVGGIKYRRGINFISFEGLSAQNFLAMAEWIPAENLEEGHNEGPPVSIFLALAQKEPAALFEGFIITAERDDEAFTIDGVQVPSAFDFAGTGIDPATADEDDILDSGYRRLWWD